MTHLSDLADTHAADARDEAASDRAGAYMSDDPRRPSFGAEEPAEGREWCSICEHGYGGHVCRWCIALGMTPTREAS